jgi:hypothetical protein
LASYDFAGKLDDADEMPESELATSLAINPS